MITMPDNLIVLATDTLSGQSLSAELLMSQQTIDGSGVIGVSVTMTGLNATAATLRYRVVVTRGASAIQVVNQRQSYTKGNDTDQAVGALLVAQLPVVDGDVVAIYAISDNALDTNVQTTVQYIDMTSVNIGAINNISTAAESLANKINHLDVAVSSRSSHSANDVWAVTTRTLTSFGSLVSTIWSAATRTLSAGTRDTEIDAINGRLPATPAAAGDAMTLTPGERTATAAAIEAAIVNEADTTTVLQAIADKIAEANPSLDDLTLGGIASAVQSVLQPYLDNLDAAVSSRLAASGYTASDNATIAAIAGTATAIAARTQLIPDTPADETTLLAVKSVSESVDSKLTAQRASRLDAVAQTGDNMGISNDGRTVVESATASALATYDSSTRAEAISDKNEIIARVDASRIVMVPSTSIVVGEYFTSLGVQGRDLSIAQHASGVFLFAVEDGNGDPVNLSGKSVRFVVHDAQDMVVFQTDTGGAGVSVTGDDDNYIVVVVGGDNTATAGEYFFKLWNITNNDLLGTGDFVIKAAPIGS